MGGEKLKEQKDRKANEEMKAHTHRGWGKKQNNNNKYVCDRNHKKRRRQPTMRAEAELRFFCVYFIFKYNILPFETFYYGKEIFPS